MHVNTLLDCDLVALESADELTLLVELTAPDKPVDATRGPATLQVVLDRSGSMAGSRLEGAKAALLALVDRLAPTDNLGVVAFDDGVQVVVPAGPLTDKTAVKRAIAAVEPGGSTDLSGGYLRGLQEARRVAGPGGGTLLLVSDGHANAGVQDPDQLRDVAAKAQADGLTTSTVGFGLGYDERLLSALAQGGAGNELFAEEADTAVALISGEVDGLLDQVAQAVSLRVRWTDAVTAATVLNDLPTSLLPDGFAVELGSFWSGESRKLLVKLLVPGIPALGLARVATLELTHVSLPDLVQHTTILPVHVNVVPGDQAAGRVPDPVVVSEALFQQTQRAKREASRLLSQGDASAADALLRRTSTSLRSDAGLLPDAMAAELLDEATMLEALADEARVDTSRAAKVGSYDSAMKSRNRGRQSAGGRVLLVAAGGEQLLLEEWEAVRLSRLPGQLGPALRPGAVQTAEVCRDIAAFLGEEHPLYDWFSTADGFTVGRA